MCESESVCEGVCERVRVCVSIYVCVYVCIRDETNNRVGLPGHGYFCYQCTRTFHINPPLAISNNGSHIARPVFTFYLVWLHTPKK